MTNREPNKDQNIEETLENPNGSKEEPTPEASAEETPAEPVENEGEPEEVFLDDDAGVAEEAEEREDAAAEEEQGGDAYQDKFARLMAEFDNFRKRSMKEKAQERQRGRRDAAEKLLPVFDSLTMGLLTAKEDDPMRQGLEAVFNQLMNSFQQLGIERVETKGLPFDPEMMEAVAKIPNEEVEADYVVEESRAGFQDDLGLLRPAQVIVSAGSSE